MRLCQLHTVPNNLFLMGVYSLLTEHRKQGNSYPVIKFILHCVLPGSFAQGFVGGYHLLPKIL